MTVTNSESALWYKTIPAADVERDGVARAQAGGRRIALYAVEGEYFATSDVCTHGQAFLSDGYLDGHLIECPLHQGLFDVRTGAAAGAPCTVPVRSFPVKVEDGVLHVQIEEA
ncbi:rieske (2Fe-2S) domain protein (plasmid) [Azospirillum sp. B510]|uniref:non-heme iron oxygenase ferredoxin subunit n=1 Tax=Azospirillum sp. (strain B510) TaxID=137722 RepID=UPI0001C4BBF8|nr:non-heme iron oxygenase ferredoxin subunit [Azospirillum sp. B510]BAI74450.1 rieske (2Fe-2S) domain protein [Azospirillum sp. B510]